MTITWDIPVDQKPGMYKITYNCDHKSLFGGISSVTGSTQWFQVLASNKKLDKLRQKNRIFGKKMENNVKKNYFEKMFSKFRNNRKTESNAL